MTTLTAATPSMAGGLAPATSARAPGPPPTSLNVTDVIRIIKHRFILIASLWAFFIVVTAVTTALFIKYDPKFAAESWIEVQSTRPPNPMSPLDQPTARQDEIERLLANQALMVKSPDVLSRALQDAALRNTSWFTEAQEREEKYHEDPMVLLEEQVGASPIRDSNFLRVSTAWKVPSEAAVLVNTVVGKYMALVDETQKKGIRTIDEQLDKELGRQAKLLEDKRQEIERLRSSQEVLVGGEGPSERLLTLMALVTELEVEMLGRKAIWEQYQNATPETLPITPELQALLENDPVIFQLGQRLQQAEESLGVAMDRYGQNHRVVKESKLLRDSIAQREEEERAVKLLRYQQEQIEQASRSFLDAQQMLLELKDSLLQAKEEQGDKDTQYARYERLLGEQDQLKLQYESLMEQKNILTMALRQEKSVQIDVRSTAIPPKLRSSPQWILWLPMGSLLGLILSVGFAFLLELADKSVRTPRDVGGMSVLGLIPTSDDDEIEIARPETASIDAPHSIVAEAFRTLRANLFFSAPAEQQGVLLVTSPSGGNGKTTVATNLAISIALSGRRVLLIDANFRRASLPRLFPNARPEGLSNVLIGQARLADLVTPTHVPGLDVLSAGPIPPNPAELLGGSYLRDVVADGRSQYDQVIFDGPPVLLVSDAMVLAGAVDGVLVVCQYRSTSRGALQRTQSQLGAINTRIFGGVLNLVETRRGGYFRKAYREFYEYHEPLPGEGLPAPRPDLQLGTGPQGAAVGAAAGAFGEVAGEIASGQPEEAAPAGAAAGEAPLDLGLEEQIDLAGPPAADGTEGSGGVEGLSAGLRDLDREIDSLGGDATLGPDLEIRDEFKLEDLDLDDGAEGPDKR